MINNKDRGVLVFNQKQLYIEIDITVKHFIVK